MEHCEVCEEEKEDVTYKLDDMNVCLDCYSGAIDDATDKYGDEE